MSRREAREHETRRSYSKIEREPSPKRSRRDGKPKTERNTSRNSELDTIQCNDQDRKLRGRLQDALPLEVSIEPESKVGLDNAKSESKKKTGEKESDGIKQSIDPKEGTRSRSFFQHDERSVSGQGARSFGGRATERGWLNDSKGRPSERHGGNEKPRKREERTQAGGAEDDVWRHDRFQKFEEGEVPPARKRPQFREKKIEQESRSTTGIAAPESERPSLLEQPASENARKEEWGGRRPYESDRPEKPFIGDRGPLNRRETQRVGFSSRERFGGGGSMGRDGFSRRYGERNQNNNIGTEKWKHDMFDEANKSPSPKNAEDQIAKIEALLAS